MEQQRKPKRSMKWQPEEDDKLREEVNTKPKQNWCSVARNAGLNRSGNSCRLRWFNRLKPGDRPGKLTDEEKLLILEFRSILGKNCWAKIAKKLLPGRRDNYVKNFWHTLAKRAKRANCDLDSEAVLQKEELLQKIRAAGKFTMDYSSLIPNDAYSILKKLFPDLAVAATAVAANFADTGGADAIISTNPVDTVEVRHDFSVYIREGR